MSVHIEITPLSKAKRRRVLLEFDDLLKSPTAEKAWQQFFDTYPNLLADSLSLQLTGICSQVRLLAGTPDYVFHRSLGGTTGDYGVIELKRPNDSILGTYSVKHVRCLGSNSPFLHFFMGVFRCLEKSLPSIILIYY